MSSRKTTDKSAASRDAVLGSPPRTTICFLYAVMLWPDRADGDGPIFWNVYQRRLEILNAARSPRSAPSSVRPPKTYMTSSTIVAAWPSLGAGMYPMQSNWVHVFGTGS